MWVLCSTYPWFSSVALIQSRNDCETELVNLDTISRICIMPDYGKMAIQAMIRYCVMV